MKLPLLSKGLGVALGVLCLAIAPIPKVSAAEVNWASGVISVVGEGVPPEQGSPAKRRLLAKRAAITDAYRKLAEAVHGVNVDARTVVKDLETQSDEVRTTVSGLIKGAQVVQENITNDGAYEVRVNLPLFGDNSLASAVLSTSLNNHRQQMITSVPTRKETSDQLQTALPNPSSYTGLIVDARKLSAKAAMMPILLDDKGCELYLGGLQIKDADLIAQGPVSYTKSIEEGKQNPRAGSNPLILRAKRYSGPFHADLVLAEDDAQKLQALSQGTDVLKKLSVIVVL